MWHMWTAEPCYLKSGVQKKKILHDFEVWNRLVSCSNVKVTLNYK